MRKRKVFLTVCAIITLTIILGATINASASQDNLQEQQQKQAQYAQQFNSYQLKTELNNRDDAIAELNRLGSLYKNAHQGHNNDEYSKEIESKFRDFSKQLQEKIAQYPAPIIDTKQKIENKLGSLKDEFASWDEDQFPSKYADAKYALDEAQSIYNQYKDGELSTDETYNRISKVVLTDRQNGIIN